MRSPFLMDCIVAAPTALPFSVCGRALEWDFPRGVGYRYLSLSQCALLLRACGLADGAFAAFLSPLL